MPLPAPAIANPKPFRKFHVLVLLHVQNAI
jgi:hypothetical protein